MPRSRGSHAARIQLDAAPAVLLPDNARWPAAFADLPESPAQLHVAGELPASEDAVAIVGTRYADADALAFTRRLAASIAAQGRWIISGGAEGVDSAAHCGALDVGGRTVAVLATGLRMAFPPRHGALFTAIAKSGGLVCEVDSAAGAPGWAFLRRNRLIAALAHATVVIQAPHKSGALSTAAWAKRLKRQVFAVPGSPWDPRFAGCLGLLRSGARICTSAADVLSLRPRMAGQGQLLAFGEGTDGSDPAVEFVKESKDDAGFGESHETRDLALSARVLRLLQFRSKHPDDLATALDTDAAKVHEALLNLVLAGVIRQNSDGSFAKTHGSPTIESESRTHGDGEKKAR